MTRHSPEVSGYAAIVASRSEDERYRLARIKRFMERLCGDAGFRAELGENLDDPRPVAERYGIEIDPAEVQPFWLRSTMKQRYSDTVGNDWPLVAEWDRYIGELLRHRDTVRAVGNTPASNPRFHAWRSRQIRRADSETGASAESIVHPIIAYELSDGCSVGCWFCGISADRFQGNFLYTPENAELWRGVLDVVVEQFGEAAGSGFCYWATDPCDNPDYPKFVEDHYHATGALPQTTTAAPLKDVALTRELLALQEKYPNLPTRFSILTVPILDKVHAEFTPDELLRVELIMQQKLALQPKANAGRARERRRKLREMGKDDKLGPVEADHSTIACVSGFLVNMVNREVRLASPTRASDRWPLGYRVHATRRFDSVESFREVIEEISETEMGSSPPQDEPVAFRDDLRFEGSEQGFDLHSPSSRHTVRGYEFVPRLGERILQGDKTGGELLAELVSEGEDIFKVSACMQDLFDGGLLRDEPPTPDELVAIGG